MHKDWQFTPYNESDVVKLQQQLGVDYQLCKLLVQRGINTFEEAKTFFRGNLNDLNDPFLMDDMREAVDRIQQAIAQQQTIVIYGDYDVDGTTAVSLLYLFFSQIHDKLLYYVPDRHKEGYGLSKAGIDFAFEHQAQLMIVLDCGIKAIEKVDYANSLNIDIIICDHHTPGEELPKAKAILNPKKSNCQYPYKELSGAGIGFKLCEAYTILVKAYADILFPLLDLVAISIACDIVPLTGENRILAKEGLNILNQSPSKGVANILGNIDLKNELSIVDVVFKIGPRINAAGRMAHAKMAVDVLIGKQPPAFLSEKNAQRKDLDSLTTEQALKQLEEKTDKSNFSNVVFRAEWNKGVIGIVASRLIETHYKPTIVFCESNGKLTGSARSVKGFNIYEPLAACEDLMVNFGGHAYAAGLTIEKNNLKLFASRFEEEVAKRIEPQQLIPKIMIDEDLKFQEITPSFYKILKQMAPFGPKNMRPVFASLNLKDTGQSRIVGENHLKLDLEDENGLKMKGIAFQLGEKIDLVKKNKVDICYVIDENRWNGVTSLQLLVKDIKAHGSHEIKS